MTQQRGHFFGTSMMIVGLAQLFALHDGKLRLDASTCSLAQVEA